MPELPEVETVVRTLEHQLKGQKIEEVKVIYPRIIDNVTPEEFEKRLASETFEEFDRRGKFLIFRLRDHVMITHLRMEGKFYYYKEETAPSKHTHAVFRLSEGWLHYNDVRKFGRFYLYDKDQPLEAIASLGYEPFDESLKPEHLKQYCRKLSQPIKSVLLDQSMIAGIGNIYADEICAKVNIDPRHPASLISLNRWQKIIDATRDVLAEAIEAGGTTIRSYTSSLGITGRFQQQLLVHSQTNCSVCGSEAVKIRLGGRGTYYCPKCQRKEPVKVAISGLIGAGKSTLTQMYEQKGYPVISCDAVNAEVLKRPETVRSLSEIFGCDEKLVDKKYISERIFADDDIRAKTEAYLHAIIWEEIESFLKQHQDDPIVFVEVPLLFETDWYRRFDVCLLVVASRETVIERLIENRGYSRQKAVDILGKQLDNERKIKMSDYVMHNDGNLVQLEKQADGFLKEINRLLERTEK
ncbi:MAG: DNA-formamidopyrimidine glycosylase [Erysipelotrichaceae bacterium]|nr:DNA-formamidopyrimidine glycosylase [Erysipelotrichaceae bacterium]